MLVTTHYLDEAEHCHRIAIIHAGRLAALGSTRELKRHVRRPRDPRDPARRSPVEAMRLLDAMPEVEKTSIFGTAVHAVLQAPAHEAAERASNDRLTQAGVAVAAIAPVQPSLEDVFLDVVGARRSMMRQRVLAVGTEGAPPDRCATGGR